MEPDKGDEEVEDTLYNQHLSTPDQTPGDESRAGKTFHSCKLKQNNFHAQTTIIDKKLKYVYPYIFKSLYAIDM